MCGAIALVNVSVILPLELGAVPVVIRSVPAVFVLPMNDTQDEPLPVPFVLHVGRSPLISSDCVSKTQFAGLLLALALIGSTVAFVALGPPINLVRIAGLYFT